MVSIFSCILENLWTYGSFTSCTISAVPGWCVVCWRLLWNFPLSEAVPRGVGKICCNAGEEGKKHTNPIYKMVISQNLRNSVVICLLSRKCWNLDCLCIIFSTYFLMENCWLITLAEGITLHTTYLCCTFSDRKKLILTLTECLWRA